MCGVSKRKVLLLGGSAQQVVAIRSAKAMGLETVLCDYLPDNPGRLVTDRYYPVSTTDSEAVAQVAEAEGVGGVLAYASDPAALTAARVAEKLGLPTNPVSAVETLGLKHRFRAFLEEAGLPCPRFYAFPASESPEQVCRAVADFPFPLVVKPTDSSGSKGVTKVADLSGIPGALQEARRFSRNGILLAEAFIERGFPDVIGGDIFVWEGRVEIFGEMACLRLGGGAGLIPVGKKKPSGLAPEQERTVHAELQRLVTALGLRFGEFNIELLLDKSGGVHFLELGPRAGGNMIPVQLSDALGVDLVRANVCAAMGDKPDLTPHPKPGCFFTYVLNASHAGTLREIALDDALERVCYRKVFYKNPGDAVEPFDGAGKALGILFLHTQTQSEMLELCANLHSRVRISLDETRSVE